MANQVEISIIAIDSASNILQRIAGRFGTLGAVAAAAIGMASQAAGQAITNTMAWADSLDNVQDKLGGTNAEVAAYAYAAKVAGISVDTFVHSNVILEKGLTTAAGKLDTTGKALEKWGVKVKDVNGKVKDQATLTTDIAKKYGELATAQERVNFLTEIYGRQGAELIDFFDVLNGEGGVGTLAQKMTALGLAIDPARYEAFNRNLEKLQMIGLSLQIAFTEKLMPVFEGMLNWASAFAAADPAGRLSMIQEALSKFNLVGLTKQFRDWVASVDWGEVSRAFADGMNSVDWAGITRDVLDSAVNLESALIDAIGRTDWNSIGLALKNAFAGIVRDGIGGAIVEAWIPAAQQFWILVDNLSALIQAKFEEMKAGVVSKVQNMVAGAGAAISGFAAMMVNGISSGVALVLGKISELVEAMHAQIHVIVQVFQQIGYMAMRMLGSSIQGQIGMIINIIQKVIDSIQSSITGITIPISFDMPSIPNFGKMLGYNVAGGMSKPGGPGSSKSSKIKARASGGVIDEPVLGFGLRTGATWTFAERGPETVSPGGGGMTVVFNYQPTISLATKQEAEEAIVPFVRSAMRQLKGQAV